MSNMTQALNAKFIENKRQELTRLRDALQNTATVTEVEEGGIKDARTAEPRENEEDAQDLDALEKDGLLVNRTVQRLARVERALAKIDQGTYGLSDVSGEPIPVERLDAIPEAVNTTSEQAASEKGS